MKESIQSRENQKKISNIKDDIKEKEVSSKINKILNVNK